MGILGNIKSFINPQSTNQSASTSAVNPSVAGAKKVIVIEDEKMLADALTIKLTHAGFEVLHADNGQAGLEMIVAQKPAIVLLDLMMPVMDGKAMLQKLREIPEFKDLPVMVLTNSGTVENMHETQTNNGAVEFLIKSNVSLDEIVERIKGHIGKQNF